MLLYAHFIGERLLREEALREQERKEREEARRRERERKKKEKLKKERLLVLSCLKPMAPAIPDDITFPPDTPLKDAYTDRYETFLFEGYRKDKKEMFSSLTVDYDSVGKQILKISG